MQSYIEQAINKLAVAQDNTLRYSYIGFCATEEDFNNITGVDNFNFTWADVQAKATELETAENNKSASDRAKDKLRNMGFAEDEVALLIHE